MHNSDNIELTSLAWNTNYDKNRRPIHDCHRRMVSKKESAS